MQRTLATSGYLNRIPRIGPHHVEADRDMEQARVRMRHIRLPNGKPLELYHAASIVTERDAAERGVPLPKAKEPKP